MNRSKRQRNAYLAKKAGALSWAVRFLRQKTGNHWKFEVDRLVCHRRGRIFMTGSVMPQEPQFWFMSTVCDPTNFDVGIEESQ